MKHQVTSVIKVVTSKMAEPLFFTTFSFFGLAETVLAPIQALSFSFMPIQVLLLDKLVAVSAVSNFLWVVQCILKLRSSTFRVITSFDDLLYLVENRSRTSKTISRTVYHKLDRLSFSYHEKRLFWKLWRYQSIIGLLNISWTFKEWSLRIFLIMRYF